MSFHCTSCVVLKKYKGGRSKFEIESLVIEHIEFWLYYVTYILDIDVCNVQLIATNNSMECLMRVN